MPLAPSSSTLVRFIEPRKLLGIDADTQLTQEHLHRTHCSITSNATAGSPIHTQSLVSAVAMLGMEAKLCKADADCVGLTHDLERTRELSTLLEQRAQEAVKDLEAKVSGLEDVARCAPTSAESVLSFLRVRCVQRSDMSSSTAQLYGAYVAFF